jgi:hypothetical protein
MLLVTTNKIAVAAFLAATFLVSLVGATSIIRVSATLVHFVFGTASSSATSVRFFGTA